MNKHQRLKEYGMYIRKNSRSMYNLGWTDSQRPGGLAEFPTWDDAYNAFEDTVLCFWDARMEDFQTYMEESLYHAQKSPQLERAHTEHEQHLEESRNKLYDLTKL